MKSLSHLFQLAVKLRQPLRKTWELGKGIIATRSGLSYQQPDTSSEDRRDTPEAPTNSRVRRQRRTRETDHGIDLDEHIFLDEEGVRQYLRIGSSQFRDHVESLPKEIRRHPTLSFVDTFLTRFNRHIDTLNFPYAPRYQNYSPTNPEVLREVQESLLDYGSPNYSPASPPYSPGSNSYEQRSPTLPIHSDSESDESTGAWSSAVSLPSNDSSEHGSPAHGSTSPLYSPPRNSYSEHRGSPRQDSTPEELNEAESEEELEPTDWDPPQDTRLHCIGLQAYPRSPRSAEL